MKKTPLIVLCILYILQANAQSKKSTELILSYNPKLYFNEKNMLHTPAQQEPDKSFKGMVTAPYSYNSTFDIDLQQTTRYGFIYGIGFNIGQRSHSITFNLPANSVSEIERENSLMSQFDYYKDYQHEYSYTKKVYGIKLRMGYNFKLPLGILKKMTFDAYTDVVINCQSKVRFKTQNETRYSFINDDFLSNYIINAFTVKQNSNYEHVNFYFGTNVPLKWKLLKNIKMGLTISQAIDLVGGEKRHDLVNLDYYDFPSNVYGVPTNTMRYQSKEFSIGFKIGLGIGK